VRSKLASLKPIAACSPLRPKELAAYDAVVFDPRRAGASGQAKELASSKVPKLAAVSCNPGTLARDLRILVDGSYRITRIVPVGRSAPFLAAYRGRRPLVR
jgi:tRNA/tmRNA/rRNA uracil-C5-methylase (TrmA/RlmC/RlmD family)